MIIRECTRAHYMSARYSSGSGSGSGRARYAAAAGPIKADVSRRPTIMAEGSIVGVAGSTAVVCVGVDADIGVRYDSAMIDDARSPTMHR